MAVSKLRAGENTVTQNKIDEDNSRLRDLIFQECRDKVDEYEKMFRDIGTKVDGFAKDFSDRYLKHMETPILIVHAFIKELVEDCSFVLQIESLPDQFVFKTLEEECKREKDNIENQIKQAPQKSTRQKGGEVFMQRYVYSYDLIWKYEMLRKLLNAYNEPIVNLQFLQPYLKNNSASINSFEMINDMMLVMTPRHRATVIDNLIQELKELIEDF